jgi:ubiquinone/menaquinone biosynthesis C-methylase UbiE
MSRFSQLIRKSGRRRHLGTHAPTWFEARRPLSPAVGTAAELYRQPAQVQAVDARFAPLLAELATLATIERDTLALPAPCDREGYFGNNHFAYWLSGLADLRMVQRLVPHASFAHVLDFGGATGRFARQVMLANPTSKVTIADLNVNHVEWVEQHFDRSVRAVKVSPYPHFPLADGSVTLCVGLSVFTHIDCYESGWLAEIRRVLADGGYALLTIHSEQTWPRLPSQPELLRTLQRIPAFTQAFRLGEPMPPGRAVYEWNPNSIEHNCHVFMDSDYVRRRWSRWFEVVQIAHRAHHDFQAAVVLRKTQG